MKNHSFAITYLYGVKQLEDISASLFEPHVPLSPTGKGEEEGHHHYTTVRGAESQRDVPVPGLCSLPTEGTGHQFEVNVWAWLPWAHQLCS